MDTTSNRFIDIGQRTRLSALALVGALVLAACSDGDVAIAAPATDSSTTTTPTTTQPDTSSTTPPEASSTTLPASSPTTLDEAATATQPEGTETLVSETCQVIEDFSDGAPWTVVNDGVMGGLSQGSASIDNGVLTFSGFINTNGGGFSLIRRQSDQALGAQLADVTELSVRARSTDGRAYEIIADDSLARSNSQIMHFTSFPISGSGEWEDVIVPITNLEQRIFGNPVNVEPFRRDLATSIGIILADGVDGDFSLEIDHIATCTS